jgi:DNA-binding FadR family transcriptional regulator
LQDDRVYHDDTGSLHATNPVSFFIRSSPALAIKPEKRDLQALFEADCRFHVTLLDATGNQVMRQLRQIVLTMLRVSCEFGVSRPQNQPVTRQGHIDVAEAIARRDGEGARRAMTAMLERNQSLVAEYLGSQASRSDGTGPAASPCPQERDR